MERIKDIVISPQTGENLVYLEENNKKGFGTRDQGIVYSYVDGVIDLVDPDSDKKHKKIGKAYDQSLFMYDDYMEGRKLRWRLLKYILLGYGYDDVKECEKVADRLFERVQKGIVLEVPIGTGINTIKKYAAYPDILFVAADYSWGMLQESKRKIDELGLKNVVLARVDVAKLPFKDEVFDGLLTLNGIHSFPEKEKGMEQCHPFFLFYWRRREDSNLRCCLTSITHFECVPFNRSGTPPIYL